MPLFSISPRANKDADNKIAKKANTKSTVSTSVRGGNSLIDKINTMRAVVEKNLGYLRDEYIVIRTENSLNDYISSCIKNDIISIDTETTGLDPLKDELVGICIYTPNQKAAYIPVNHKSFITNQKVENQLSTEILHRQFQRVADSNIKVIMFNACFDIRFLRSGIGVYLTCYWDCYLASRLLNENEGRGNGGLKKLHNKYVLDGEGDAFKFDELFHGITFDLVPIDTGYLYAAHDAIITYELYEFQKPFLTADNQDCIDKGLQDVAWVFRNIEMPCVEVVANMEDTGVQFDTEYAQVLHNEYYEKLDKCRDVVFDDIDNYADELFEYVTHNPNNKLSKPINLDSPQQIAILLYDVLKIKPVDDKNSRGTGEEVLSKIDIPFTKHLLEYRGIQKLINTYIDKLPVCVNEKDGRIHCKFNQYGADTGRFSSSDPNLQNIPSHNKDIRKMFKATDGYVLMSSDYSQQEPKVMAQLCGDKKMLQAYIDGKDLYAEIAALSFHTTYDNCLEFRPDGTTNKDGKERRSQAKSILLGVLYGRGVPSIAEQLGVDVDEAQEIKDSVFKGFPAIQQFEIDSLKSAEENGYVTTLWGRKRRLPILTYPDYEFEYIDGVAPDDDPLNFESEVSTEVPDSVCRKYISKLRNTKFAQHRAIIEKAKEDGIRIIDNTKDKQDAKRQVVNSRIQGSASDMSKLAMIKVGTDERLKELGFRLLIPVHDELIGECPEENAKECAERFAYLMSTAASDKLTIPISCDVEITKQWYGDVVDI